MKKVISWIILVSLCGVAFAQSLISHNGSSNYTLVERTNLRQYLNGKYVGLTSREVRSFIFCEDEDNGTAFYSGDFYVAKDTVKSAQYVGSGIHEAIPSSFSIAKNGKLTMKEDNGYPSFRSFPVFPDTSISPGAQWKGESVRAIDPLDKGIVTKIPMTVLYTFVGKEDYKGEEVYRINCEWATRYGISYWDFGGDRDLKSAQGSHKAYALISVDTGSMVFMMDNVDETFIYNDGTKINFKGSIINFTEYPVSVQHEEILPALKRIGAVVAKADNGNTKEGSGSSKGMGGITKGENAVTKGGSGITQGEKAVTQGGSGITQSENAITKSADGIGAGGALLADGSVSSNGSSTDTDYEKWLTAGSEGLMAVSLEEATQEIAQALNSSESKILVEETDSGIKLSIHDLKFKADSDELMPGEERRLDEIASVLKMVPTSMFLVEGHTADTGYKEGELKVSKARAMKIALELSKRGLDASRFICKGVGASKPIASNKTQEGKAMNRRVEITILEK